MKSEEAGESLPGLAPMPENGPASSTDGSRLKAMAAAAGKPDRPLPPHGGLPSAISRSRRNVNLSIVSPKADGPDGSGVPLSPPPHPTASPGRLRRAISATLSSPHRLMEGKSPVATLLQGLTTMGASPRPARRAVRSDGSPGGTTRKVFDFSDGAVNASTAHSLTFRSTKPRSSISTHGAGEGSDSEDAWMGTLGSSAACSVEFELDRDGAMMALPRSTAGSVEHADSQVADTTPPANSLGVAEVVSAERRHAALLEATAGSSRRWIGADAIGPHLALPGTPEAIPAPLASPSRRVRAHAKAFLRGLSLSSVASDDGSDGAGGLTLGVDHEWNDEVAEKDERSSSVVAVGHTRTHASNKSAGKGSTIPRAVRADSRESASESVGSASTLWFSGTRRSPFPRRARKQKAAAYQQLLLPPRRLDNQLTWGVYVLGGLIFPLASVLCYIGFMQSDANQMFWLQQTAAAVLMVCWIAAVARAWLRWPGARHDPMTHCLFVSALIFMCAGAGGALYLLASDETVASVDIAMDKSDEVGDCSFLEMDTEAGVCPGGYVGQVWSELNTTTVAAAETFVLRLRDVVPALASMATGERTDLLDDTLLEGCLTDALLPLLCGIAFPPCSAADCAPLPPCRRSCNAIQSACPFVTIENVQTLARQTGGLPEPIAATMRVVAMVEDCDDSGWGHSPACAGSVSESSEFVASGCQLPVPTHDDATSAAVFDSSVTVCIVVLAAIVWLLPAVAIWWPDKHGHHTAAQGDLGVLRVRVDATSEMSVRSESGMGSTAASSSAIEADSWRSTSGNGVAPQRLAARRAAQHRRRSRARARERLLAVKRGDAPVMAVPLDIRQDGSGSFDGSLDSVREPETSDVSDEERLEEEADVDADVIFGLKGLTSPSTESTRRGYPSPNQRSGQHRSVASLSVVSPYARSPSNCVDAPSSVISVASEDSVIRSVSTVGMPHFCHVFDYRSGLIVCMLLAVGACELSMGLAVEKVDGGLNAVVVNAVAVATISVAIFAVLDWQMFYVAGIRSYCEGERNYRRLRPSDTLNWFTWARFYVLRVRARWRDNFGVQGQYFKQRLVAFETIEVVTQVVALFARAHLVSNVAFLATVVVIAVNVIGGCVLRMDACTNRKHEKELSILFELACDITYLVIGLIFTFDASELTGFGLLGFVVPSIMTLETLRSLHKMILYGRATQDAETNGVVRSLSATHHSHRRLRLMRSRSGGWVSQDEDKHPGRWKMIYAVVMVGVALPMLFVTATRLVATETYCDESFGALWDGVRLQQKSFFQGGYFSKERCGVASVTSLDLRGLDLEEIDDRISEFHSLESIDASDNERLTSVSGEVARLPKLEQLILQGTPAGASMSWRGEGLDVLPPALTSIGTLEELDVSQNQLVEIPDGLLSELRNLAVLDVSDNRLVHLPLSLSAAPSLTKLRAASNMIETLQPATWPALSRMDEIDLRNNALTEVPSFLGREHYDSLQLGGNPVTQLDWSNSKLTVLPDAVLELPLALVDVSMNSLLRELPSSVAQPSGDLTDLNFSGCSVSTLPDSFQRATGLRRIYASGNLLSSPASVAPLLTLTGATEVDLACNNLTELPTSLWSSATLQRLDLSRNALTADSFSLDVPSETALEALNLASSSGFLERVPRVLYTSALADSLRTVLLPAHLRTTDAAGISSLASVGLECAGEDDVIDGLPTIVCGVRPVVWPRPHADLSRCGI